MATLTVFQEDCIAANKQLPLYLLLACVTIRSSEQFHLRRPSELKKGRRRRDRWRQTVPDLRCSNKEDPITGCPVVRPWNVQLWCRRRMQPTTRADVGNSAKSISEVKRCCTIEAAVSEHGKAELNTLRDPKPVKLTKKRCHVFSSSGRVDKSSSSVENWLQFIPAGLKVDRPTSTSRSRVVPMSELRSINDLSTGWPGWVTDRRMLCIWRSVGEAGRRRPGNMRPHRKIRVDV